MTSGWFIPWWVACREQRLVMHCVPGSSNITWCCQKLKFANSAKWWLWDRSFWFLTPLTWCVGQEPCLQKNQGDLFLMCFPGQRVLENLVAVHGQWAALWFPEFSRFLCLHIQMPVLSSWLWRRRDEWNSFKLRWSVTSIASIQRCCHPVTASVFRQLWVMVGWGCLGTLHQDQTKVTNCFVWNYFVSK